MQSTATGITNRQAWTGDTKREMLSTEVALKALNVTKPFDPGNGARCIR